MHVVINSGPIIHLAKVGRIDLITNFFGNVFIPEEVLRKSLLKGKNRKEVSCPLGTET